METRHVGKLIQRERMKQGLTAGAVCKGLCDSSIYDKIEKGKYAGDIHLIRLILQRLGISACRAGKYLSRDEYDEMQSRFNILEYIKSSQLNKAKSTLQIYFKLYSVQSIFNVQFAEYMSARIAELDGNIEKSLKLYENTASYTIMNYESDTFTCLSLYEYFILADIARLTAAVGNKEKAELLYEKLLLYCKEKKLERWIVTCIYPKIICEILDLNVMKNWGNYNAHKWLEECDAALKVLRDTSRLHFISPLLKYRKVLLQLLGEEPDNKWDSFFEYYEWLREKYKIDGELFEWYPYYIDCKFYPVEKLIDERRKLYGMSLEKLAEGVCTPETASRIINRRISPKYSTVDALLCKLGLKGILSESIIVSEDMETHGVWDDIVQCQAIEDYDMRRKLYDRLINKLDTTIAINKKVLEYIEVEFNMDEKRYDYDTFLLPHEKMLGFNIEKIENLTIFSGIEVLIINRYFYCKDKIKDYRKLRIYEVVCNNYLSRGSMRNTFASELEGILARYASYKGNAEEYERSNNYSDIGIELELECERTHSLSSIIYCIPWNNVQKGKVASESDIKLCECAYWVAWFNKNNKRMAFYKCWIDNNSMLYKNQ